MARYLFQLGRFAFRRRWLVTALWMAVLAAFGTGAATLSGPTVNSFSIPGTEAQRAIDMLGQRFPQASAGGATARVVFAAQDGQKLTDPANRAAIEQTVTALGVGPQVAGVAEPFTAGTVNPAGSVALAQVSYRVPAADLTDASRAALTAAITPARGAGLTVEVGGDAAEAPSGQSPREILGVAVAALVLFITFGSFVAAGLPLVTALLGIAISVTAITTATGFVELGSSTPTLAVMLGLAVAIDYALLIVSRFRQEVARDGDPEQASARAVGTAGTAVVFAGLTVIIALTGLSVVGIPVLTQMGLAGAGAVAIAVLIAVTLLPALLGFARRRVAGGRNPRANRPTFGLRWARLVTSRPVPILLAAVIGLGVLATPAVDLRLGLPDDGVAAPDTSKRKAYDLLAGGFGAGFNGPLTVVVDAAHSSDPKAAAQRVADTVRQLDDVDAVMPPVLNPASDTALITVIPRSGPSSQATETLVAAIRHTSGELRTTTGAQIAVTGLTALNIDMSDKLAGALLPYLCVVVGLAMLLLLLVFRSLLVPLTAAVGFLFSLAATFGAVVAVFQWGWAGGLFGVDQTGPILSALPIFLIGVVFGLAMDYQVFLVTRIREEHTRGAAPTAAIVTGFGHGARVVTAAAIIMSAVFSGFILAEDPLVRSIGLGLAAATLLDAFVVRMTIVPAVTTLLGSRAWWLPRWLDRILPNLDVEGARLAVPVPVRDPEPQPATS